jgi:hypothetical protein
MLGIEPSGHPRDAPREAKGAPLPKQIKTEHLREARRSPAGHPRDAPKQIEAQEVRRSMPGIGPGDAPTEAKEAALPYQSMVKPSILGRCQASHPMVIRGMYRRRWMHHCQSIVSGCSSRHRCFGRTSTARTVSARASFSSTQDARGPYSIRSLLWLTSCPGCVGKRLCRSEMPMAPPSRMQGPNTRLH